MLASVRIRLGEGVPLDLGEADFMGEPSGFFMGVPSGFFMMPPPMPEIVPVSASKTGRGLLPVSQAMALRVCVAAVTGRIASWIRSTLASSSSSSMPAMPLVILSAFFTATSSSAPVTLGVGAGPV
jgi:hypothetical protein